MTWTPNSLPDLSGKVFIVTGGTSGIGLYTVARLAQHNAHVYLCARSHSKGEAAIEQIKALSPSTSNTASKINISILEMDHLSLASVVSAAKHFLSLETTLHGLINNAGIMATPYLETADGYEAQLQTNYLAHWVFTSHLLPLMLKTAQGLPAGSVRIVEVSSSAHLNAPNEGIVFEDKLSLKGPKYGAWGRYAQSKLANMLHMKTLHTLYGPGSASAKAGKGEIWTASVHPGITTGNSSLQSHVEDLPMWLKVASKLVGTDSDTASYSSIFCAASPDMKAAQSGSYFSLRSAFADPGFERKEANDPNLAAKLDDWTKKEMQEKGFAPSA